jgi:hypothetical protein
VICIHGINGKKYSEQQKSEPHYLQYKEFVEAVSQGSAPILDGSEGIDSPEACQGCL